MSYAQHREGEEELSAQIATAVTAQPPSPLPPRYRPLIGMLASPSRRADGNWQVIGADTTCIEAVLAAGGEVRLIPLARPDWKRIPSSRSCKPSSSSMASFSPAVPATSTRGSTASNHRRKRPRQSHCWTGG